MNAKTLLHGGKLTNHIFLMSLLWLDRFLKLLGHMSLGHSWTYWVILKQNECSTLQVYAQICNVFN